MAAVDSGPQELVLLVERGESLLELLSRATPPTLAELCARRASSTAVAALGSLRRHTPVGPSHELGPSHKQSSARPALTAWALDLRLLS